MNRRKLPFPALAGVALVIVLGLAGCSGDNAGSTASGNLPAAETASSPSTKAPFNDADVMFAQMMIPHHREAVEMAELADTRAKNAEVKALSEKIKAAQQPEIDLMTGWLEEWEQPTDAPSDGMGHGMPGDMSDGEMKKLSAATGNEFDKEFLTMMIAHHEGAIEMAYGQLRDGANTDALTLAQNIISDQSGEIDTMNALLTGL